MWKSRKRSWLSVAAVLLGMTFLVPAAPAQTAPLRKKALALENLGRWVEACGLYDELLGKDRNNPDLREAYRRCLRRFRQVRRFQDRALQTALARYATSQALDLYDQVVGTVLGNYVERDRVDLTFLFQNGIQEIRCALQEKLFVRQFLTRIAAAEVEAFKVRLAQLEGESVPHRGRARDLLRQLLQSGSTLLRLPAGVLALECACGACNCLDEYSLYLAPHRYAHARAARKGKFVGIGIELAVVNQCLEIARVYKKSPAAEAGLVNGDRVIRIDGQRLDPMAPDVAAERLSGAAGTSVELEVLRRGQSLAQMVKIERQEVLATSVDAELRRSGDYWVGYLRLYNFQESTLQEVKEALLQWQGMGMPLRGVILDLRGNPGGLFKSSLAVAELFLPEGILAHTQSPLRDFNRTYRAHNGSPCLLPLVVLVDGETASAAEVLVGALKDNRRTEKVIGYPTYGKGSIQCVLPLEGWPGGVRLTVARFSSPARIPLSGRGILPDRLPEPGEGDTALKLAEQILRELLPQMMPQNTPALAGPRPGVS